MEKYNPVNWFEIYVQDINRAQKFYEQVLGIKMTNLPNPTTDDVKMVVFTNTDAMDKAGATGSLVQMQGMPSGGNSTLVYFMSEDCGVEESRVAGAGGKIFKPIMAIGEHGFISLCKETEGNMFGLHSMK